MRTFAVYNLKGGVGKTATAVNLAFLSALGGARTLIWDLDPQGAASFYFRAEPSLKGGGKKLLAGDAEVAGMVRPTEYDGLDLLPADFSFRNLDLLLDATKRPKRGLSRVLEGVGEAYDHTFLDCPPSVSLVSEAVLHAADVLLVPLIPTPLSMRTLEMVDTFAARQGPEGLVVLPFFCLADLRRKLHRETVELKDLPRSRFLPTAIPYASVIEQMGTRLAPVGAYAPSSPAAGAYLSLWRDIVRRVGRRLGRP
ncbi:MAG: ParA family protein [Acidobacteriota bacterium]